MAETIVYTGSDGLTPTPTPDENTVYEVHIFTSSGNLNLPSEKSVDYLIAGGGGAGGHGGGGGGAGSLKIGTTVLPAGIYPIVVGVGGAPAEALYTRGSDGTPSSFNSIIALGGGAGGALSLGTSGSLELATGNDGGCGGGASQGWDCYPPGGNGLDGYGGGAGTYIWLTATGAGGGGGGASATGTDSSGSTAGDGGAGTYSTISGTNTSYSDGGGGGAYNTVGGAGGNGSGGAGGFVGTAATDPVANTGSGGGGTYDTGYGSAGADGVVIVRYLYSALSPNVDTTDATDVAETSFTANGEASSSTTTNEFTFETDTSDSNGETVTVTGDVSVVDGEGKFVYTSGLQTFLTETIVASTDLQDQDLVITLTDFRLTVEQDMILLIWNGTGNYSVQLAPSTNELFMGMWFGSTYYVKWSLGAGFDYSVNHTFEITKTSKAYTAKCDGVPLTETFNDMDGKSWGSLEGGTLYIGDVWAGIDTTMYIGNIEVAIPFTTPTTSRGFVYKIGSGQTPTLEDYDDIFTESGGDGLFSHSFTGLTSGTTYSVRAFAINTEGTGLGDVVEATTTSASIIVTTLACDAFASSFRANASISPSIYAVDTVGFIYYNVSNPDPLRIAQRTGDFTGAFSFSEVISAGIGPNGSYMVKAFVKYNDVTYYGEWVLVSTIVISEIEVTPILPELQIGETVQLTVTATYTDGSTADLTSFAGYSSQDLVVFVPVYGEDNTFDIYSSTGDTIATVSSGGLITGISGGIAKIYIYVSGFKDTASLTVVQPAEGTVDVGGIWDGGLAPGTVIPNIIGIELIIDSSMYVTLSQQALLYGEYDDSPSTTSLMNNRDAEWSSSDTTVATIDENGLIVAIAVGVTFIKVSYTTTDSPEITYTSMAMLRVEAQEGLVVSGQPYQYIPLSPDPNQSFRLTVAASEDKSVELDFNLRWNSETECWYMTLSDPIEQEYYVDDIPLLAGEQSMKNILRLYSYLDIGSCYIIDVSGKGTGKPDLYNLGIDFVMIWGYTE